MSRTAYYKRRIDKAERDSNVIDQLNKLVTKHTRWGFWKCFKAIRRKGLIWNHKRVHRVYCEMGLNLKRRAKKRLPRRDKQPLVVPKRANMTWSADFMSDAFYQGGRFRTFNVIDDHNREVLWIEIDTSITGRRLIRVFEQLKISRGLPGSLRVDNGPEFLSADFVTWCDENHMAICYIEPGKPDQNAYIERFNRTYREEVLDLYLFRDLREVREATYNWMIEYNEERPHDSLEDLTPIEYAEKTAGNSILEVSL